MYVDMFRSVPSIENPEVSVLDEYYWLNKHDPYSSLLPVSNQNCGEDALMDLHKNNMVLMGVFIYSDCGLNQNPTSEQLVDIAKSSAESFELLVEEEPKVAFLSHSTYGSSNVLIVKSS